MWSCKKINLGLTRLAKASWRIDAEIDLAGRLSVSLTRTQHQKAITDAA